MKTQHIEYTIPNWFGNPCFGSVNPLSLNNVKKP